MLKEKYVVAATVASYANIVAAVLVGNKVRKITDSTAAGVAAGIWTRIGLDFLTGCTIGVVDHLTGDDKNCDEDASF